MQEKHVIRIYKYDLISLSVCMHVNERNGLQG